MSRKGGQPTRPIERKVLPVAVIDVDAQGIVEAIVAVLGNIDDGLDIIHTGAFAKTISERAKRIKVLDHHNMWSVRDVIGVPLEMREIGRDELPDELLAQYPGAVGGLWTKTQFLLNTPEGKGAFDRIQAGAITEYSIGYEVIQSDYSKVERDGRQNSIRNIREIRLWEYSPVIWGMNPATTTVGVKEFLPDGSSRRLLGDALMAAVHGQFMMKSASYYGEGMLSANEYAQMVTLGTQLLELLMDSIPDDIASRELDWYMWSEDAPDEHKRIPQDDDQAGPPLPTDEASEVKEDEAPTLDVERLRQEIDLGLTEIDLWEASER